MHWLSVFGHFLIFAAICWCFYALGYHRASCPRDGSVEAVATRIIIVIYLAAIALLGLVELFW